MEVFLYYLMNCAIDLHWDDEVCIADGLQEDKTWGDDSKLVQYFFGCSNQPSHTPTSCVKKEEE